LSDPGRARSPVLPNQDVVVKRTVSHLSGRSKGKLVSAIAGNDLRDGCHDRPWEALIKCGLETIDSLDRTELGTFECNCLSGLS
jgi:hypothetical protein